MVILFTTYESMKQNQHFILRQFQRTSEDIDIDEDDESDMTITTFRSTLFGGVSGALAGFCTTPFDVIKTKIMTTPVVPGTMSSASIFKVARDIIQYQRNVIQQNINSINGGSGSRNGLVGSIKVAVGPYSTFFTGATARSVWWFGICSIFFPIYERSKETLRNYSS
jgi:hypothetical protein